MTDSNTQEDYNEPRGVLYVLLCLLLLAGSVFAGTFTIGGGTAPEARVSYINDGAATTNYGTADTARVEAYQDPIECLKVMRFLIWWPALSDSLYGRTVTSATLYLTPKYIYIPTDPDGGSSLRLNPVASGRAWGETQVTQNKYKTSNWSTAGAWNTTSDYYTTSSYTGDFTVFSVNTAHACSITSIMQTCDGTDTLKNKGVIATTVQTNGFCAIMTIYSNDHATAGYRPYITVTYADPATGSDSRRRKENSCVERIKTYAFGR